MRHRTGFCKTHPTYQAKRPPTANCQACRIAYDKEQAKRTRFREATDFLIKQYPEAQRIELRVDDRMAVITHA